MNAPHPSLPPRMRQQSLPGIIKPKSVVQQVRAAAHPRARLATAIGSVLGGFVPLATWQVAHHELTAAPLWQQHATLLVLGGLAYSSTNVYSWGRQAFRGRVKAAAFVLLLEGVLVGSSTHWLHVAALCLLAGVNAITTGATLSVES